MASQSEKTQGSIHDFTVEDARGNDVDLSTYKGKVLLIVNVASRCGLTNSNYTQLNQLYEKYKNQDFEILAFPCNQFGSEEPGDNEQILDFVFTRFKSKFPIFDKVDVNGNNATPVYKFLKSSKGGIFGDSIKWNFAKFLVDKDGHVVGRYAPTTSPLRIEKGIKKLLGVFRTRNKCIREDPLADDVAQEPEGSTVPEHDLCETWLYLSEDEETTLDHS